MRFLSLDLGLRRTGVAVGDDRTRMISPVAVIAHPPGAEFDRVLARLVAEHGPDALVVGLPLNMDDSEGPAAKAARRRGEAIAALVGLPVHFQDERLTSFAADAAMARSGRTHAEKKALRDALAAAEVLRDFLGREKGEGRREEGGAW